jgi:hypothetical protein
MTPRAACKTINRRNTVPDQPELTPPTPPEDENYEDNFIEEASDTPVDAVPAAPSAPVMPPPAQPVQPAAPVVTVTPVEPPAAETPPSRATLPPVEAAAPSNPAAPAADNFSERLERLGGEPAPVITPEEFSRLQNAGQVHIDAMGRVRTARRASQADAGVTLRKRRAWYSS